MRQLGIDMQIDIEAAFAPKLWCYVPVMDANGCSLGIAVANEAGYSPAPPTRYCVTNFEDAQAEADRLNSLRGMDTDTTFRIIASSIAQGQINGQRVRSVG